MYYKGLYYTVLSHLMMYSTMYYCNVFYVDLSRAAHSAALGGGGVGVGCHSALMQAGTIHPWLAGGQTQGEQETVGKEVVSGMFIKLNRRYRYYL